MQTIWLRRFANIAPGTIVFIHYLNQDKAREGSNNLDEVLSKIGKSGFAIVKLHNPDPFTYKCSNCGGDTWNAHNFRCRVHVCGDTLVEPTDNILDTDPK